MQTKSVTLLFLSVLAFAAACRTGSPTGEQTIKSTKVGELTVTLANSTGQVTHGENDLTLSFTDASGKLVDVGAASLSFHMAGMGSMAEMNDRATLTTTDTPGKYRAHIKVEMGGTWEAQIAYQGPQGTGKASMNVQTK
ncbi:MAG: FixH family protein [Acidobacteria bacterium]|nr:FixH family protein [Acidobacteriota bacterium]MBI3422065.1 FixH family protein [Acidobacteriota bacterium]